MVECTVDLEMILTGALISNFFSVPEEDAARTDYHTRSVLGSSKVSLNNQLPKDIYEIFEKSYGFTPDNFHYDLLNHVHSRDCYRAKGTV